MILIVCVDDHMGLIFNRRRQTSDRRVVERILEMTAGGKLWINSYTAKLFAGRECPQVQVDDAFLDKAGAEEYCFIETVDPAAWEEKAERIVVYRWNRLYPSDLCCSLSLQENGWSLLCSSEFAGHSHDKITEEVYIR